MGCTSSTEVVTDPHSGQVKAKKKLGGSYPGNRVPDHAPYRPTANEFDQNGQAVAHFVAYGGGNALTLKPTNTNTNHNHNNPYSDGKTPPEYIQVTLPPGVVAGQTIHVQAPDGRLNAIVVPPGFGPGSTFTVEFVNEGEEEGPNNTNNNEESKKPQEEDEIAVGNYNYNTVPTVQASVYDGFGSGFAPSAPTSSTTSYNPYSHYSSASTTATATTVPHSNNNNYHRQDAQDDGFASGFGRR